MKPLAEKKLDIVIVTNIDMPLVSTVATKVRAKLKHTRLAMPKSLPIISPGYLHLVGLGDSTCRECGRSQLLNQQIMIKLSEHLGAFLTVIKFSVEDETSGHQVFVSCAYSF